MTDTPCSANNELTVDESHARPWGTDLHPDDWFVDLGVAQDSTEGRYRRRAKQACWTDCPQKVRLQCLTIGLEEPYGIWGGYDAAERREIVTARNERAADLQED